MLLKGSIHFPVGIIWKDMFCNVLYLCYMFLNSGNCTPSQQTVSQGLGWLEEKNTDLRLPSSQLCRFLMASENAWEVPRTLRFWMYSSQNSWKIHHGMSRWISYFPIQHGDFPLLFVSFQGFNVSLRFWDLQSPRFWFKMLVVWDLRSPKLPAKTHQNGWLEDEISFWGPGYLSFRESTSPRVFFSEFFLESLGGRSLSYLKPIALWYSGN